MDLTLISRRSEWSSRYFLAIAFFYDFSSTKVTKGKRVRKDDEANFRRPEPGKSIERRVKSIFEREIKGIIIKRVESMKHAGTRLSAPF